MKWLKRLIARLDEPPIVNRVPFQLWVMAASFNGGLGIFFTAEPPSIERFITPVLVYVWTFSLIGFPVAVFYSLLKRNRVDGLRLETYLLVPFGLTLLVYPIAVIASAGANGIIAALFSIAGAASCWTTAVFIYRRLAREGLWNQGE